MTTHTPWRRGGRLRRPNIAQNHRAPVGARGCANENVGVVSFHAGRGRTPNGSQRPAHFTTERIIQYNDPVDSSPCRQGQEESRHREVPYSHVARRRVSHPRRDNPVFSRVRAGTRAIRATRGTRSSGLRTASGLASTPEGRHGPRVGLLGLALRRAERRDRRASDRSGGGEALRFAF